MNGVTKLSSEWHRLGPTVDFPQDEAVLVDESPFGPLVVVFQGGKFNVLSGVCTHEDFELDGSPVQDGQLTCMLHMSSFSLTTGEALSPPAEEPLKVFESKVSEGQVYVRKMVH